MSTESDYLPGASSWSNNQVRAYEASDGTKQGDLRGVPVVILTTRGRKSGALRKAPLMRVNDGEKYAVIASLGGAPEHPVWYLNLLADPQVTLQDKDVKRRYLAHPASGDERDQWWARAVAVWPDYASYQRKQTGRSRWWSSYRSMGTPTEQSGSCWGRPNLGYPAPASVTGISPVRATLPPTGACSR